MAKSFHELKSFQKLWRWFSDFVTVLDKIPKLFHTTSPALFSVVQNFNLSCAHADETHMLLRHAPPRVSAQFRAAVQLVVITGCQLALSAAMAASAGTDGPWASHVGPQTCSQTEPGGTGGTDWGKALEANGSQRTNPVCSLICSSYRLLWACHFMASSAWLHSCMHGRTYAGERVCRVEIGWGNDALSGNVKRITMQSDSKRLS